MVCKTMRWKFSRFSSCSTSNLRLFSSYSASCLLFRSSDSRNRLSVRNWVCSVGYPPVSTQFIFDPVTSPRIKVTFDPPFDWPVINQFKHITNKYICEISKANHRWNPKVVNLLDSNLHKIFPNMLVPQHNRFRNLPSITNNNFVH